MSGSIEMKWIKVYTHVVRTDSYDNGSSLPEEAEIQMSLGLLPQSKAFHLIQSILREYHHSIDEYIVDDAGFRRKLTLSLICTA